MKKFLLLSILIFSFALNILFVNSVEAKDHYLGVYEDGREAYVMTETVKYYEEHRHGYLVAQGYNCTLKAVYPHSDNVEYIVVVK